MTASLDPTAPASDETSAHVDVLVGGMTCGACARRVERTLNKLDGVTATVNYATEKASVTHTGAVTVEQILAAVERAGYTAALPVPRKPRSDRRWIRSAGSLASGCWSAVCWRCRSSPPRWCLRCSSTTGSGCRSR